MHRFRALYAARDPIASASSRKEEKEREREMIQGLRKRYSPRIKKPRSRYFNRVHERKKKVIHLAAEAFLSFSLSLSLSSESREEIPASHVQTQIGDTIRALPSRE